MGPFRFSPVSDCCRGIVTCRLRPTPRPRNVGDVGATRGGPSPNPSSGGSGGVVLTSRVPECGDAGNSVPPDLACHTSMGPPPTVDRIPDGVQRSLAVGPRRRPRGMASGTNCAGGEVRFLGRRQVRVGGPRPGVEDGGGGGGLPDGRRVPGEQLVAVVGEGRGATGPGPTAPSGARRVASRSGRWSRAPRTPGPGPGRSTGVVRRGWQERWGACPCGPRRRGRRMGP